MERPNEGNFELALENIDYYLSTTWFGLDGKTSVRGACGKEGCGHKE